MKKATVLEARIQEARERSKQTSALLRFLADSYEQSQKLRIASENRVRAMKQGTDETHDEDQDDMFAFLADDMHAIEHKLYTRMRKLVKNHPAWPWLSTVKGIGPTLATKLLGLIPDISSFDTVSKLWRYAGYGVVDGKAERPQKGEKLHYNKRLKTTLYLVGTQFLKANSPYRRIYDDAKRYYQENRDWTPGHIHQAAMRKMVKVFLQHLWVVWRTELDLPVRDIYALEKLGHTTYYTWEEFVEEHVG